MTANSGAAAASDSQGSDHSPSTVARRWQQLRLLQHELSRELQFRERYAAEGGTDSSSDTELHAAQREVGALMAPQRPLAPPPPCSFLRPGQCFDGLQRVAQIGVRKNECWGVHVTIQGYEPSRGYVCGTMEASNVPEASLDHPVTTFFEGEVVDNVHHSFYTADWAACAQTDLRHWSKFQGFAALHMEVVKNGGRSAALATHPYVFMRWKERFFVRGSESRLTIAGFYYVCIRRSDGQVEGLYYDPSSSPDQKLELEAVTEGDAGHAWGHYDLA